jgi:type IV secretory pathway TraG/TraD family ATPase VirD4
MVDSFFKDVADLYSALFTSGFSIAGILVLVVLFLAVLWFIGFVAKGKLLKIGSLVLCQVIALGVAYKIGSLLPAYLGMFFLPSLAIGSLLYFISPYSGLHQENKYTVRFSTSKGNLYADIRQHLALFGATGAGKTDSVYVSLIKHIFKFGLSGVIFDYKDFELMEKVYYFEEQQKKTNAKEKAAGRAVVEVPRLYTFYPAEPNLSHHLNPVLPKYLSKMEDVEVIANTLFDNLYPGSGKEEGFFKKSGAGAFAGVLWRLKDEFPQYCTFPHVCAMIVDADADELILFIRKNVKAKVLAAPYIDSAGNRKQLASVKSSISSAVKYLCTPSLFMVLSKSDFDLGVNDPNNLSIVGLVNKPKYDSVYLPILATVARIMMDQCAVRGRDYSLWLLDEASTFKVNLLHRVLATLRTFKVLIIWGLQDKIQGELLYSLGELKAIFSNLGYQILGKANDPDTAEYYTKLFETIEVAEKTVSSGDGSTRTSTSIREKKKYKAIEFRRLLAGEFFIIDKNGMDHKTRFKAEPYETRKPEQINFYSDEEIEHNFNTVFAKVRELINQEAPPEEMEKLNQQRGMS